VYCEDAGSTRPKEYLEMASKCTLVTQGVTRTTIFKRFLGPQLRVQTNLTGFVHIRRRLSLAAGSAGICAKEKTPGAVVEKGISPPSFARFGDNLETFPKGDH
jgi:hypothetical protein